ncbi:hypothetical protein NL393_38700, partial [Klebsiella pneumoniae]|nr:hypothetical protein [Klebsiella pneumoniae]
RFDSVSGHHLQLLVVAKLPEATQKTRLVRVFCCLRFLLQLSAPFFKDSTSMASNTKQQKRAKRAASKAKQNRMVRSGQAV